jgi:glycosyltransferase involved in cell wall biosynthesis
MKEVQHHSEMPRLGYVLSRFPKLSETFILREMEALEDLGWHITVFPFIRASEPVRHTLVDRWTTRMGKPETRVDLLKSNLLWLLVAPIRLLGLYIQVCRDLWRYPGELLRGLVGVARGAYWARQVQVLRVRHVHAHFALHPAIAAMTIARLARISYSFTCHAQDVYRVQAMLDVKSKHACFVVAISRVLQEQYLARHVQPGDLAKVQVIRCGVDLARYRRRAVAPPTQPLSILAVARLVEKKGLHYLIDACAMLHARGYPIRCRIIGDGPLHGRLAAHIRSAGLDDLLVLEGPRTEEEVHAALASATVFVQPSIVTAEGDMEGVPVSVMEAMAIGLPVVATQTGAIPELVRHRQTGLLVAPGDAAALAAAIVELYSHPDLAARLVANARQLIEEEFDLRKNVLQLDYLLRRATIAATTVSAAGATGTAVILRTPDTIA